MQTATANTGRTVTKENIWLILDLTCMRSEKKN
jgi:hypothetical protein